MGKLKILAAGDFDGKSFICKNLAQKAKENNVDLVVLCGDITDDNNINSDIIKPFASQLLFVLSFFPLR